MPDRSNIDVASLKARARKLDSRYEAFRARGLSLDMTRGKPSTPQLDLAKGLLAAVGPDDFRAEDGTDCRNYGGLTGLPEAKRLFAAFMGVGENEILVGDNSSLSLMHDTIARALSHGVPGGSGPWSKGPVRFLCPVPGYDRHFSVCEHFGIEMINVDMADEGPDMDAVERLAGDDPAVKGMWVVPKYSNPTGATCSRAVVERLATMKTAAPDFRVMWDNAYAHHHLGSERPRLECLLAACKESGNPDRVFMYGSTSKVSFAGAGVGVMAASSANLAWMQGHRFFSTIGPDKLNQLRHVRFFGDMKGVEAHMQKHAALLAPKFETVDRVLRRELEGTGVAEWTKPKGGYFTSLDTLDGCAKEVVAMAGSVGVKLTKAGATFPYGRDPRDRNIRIAPTLPPLEDIEVAMEVLAVCILKASLKVL